MSEHLDTTNTKLDESTAIAIVANTEAYIALPRSVVKSAYKAKYAQRVLDGARGKKGVSKKAQARSCGDWLALELAARVLDSKNKLVLEAFLAILDANHVDHSRWTNRSKGWEGRLRMTGRLALQKVVANEEQLYLPDGVILRAPKSWIAQHQH